MDWVNCVLNINVNNFNKLIVSLSVFLFFLQCSVSTKSEEIKSRFSGQLDIGGSLTSGNTDTTRLDVEINIRNLKGRFEDNFRVLGAFSKDNKETTEQRFLISYESYLELRKNLFGFSYIKFDDDNFSGFNYEIEASAGSGYKLINERDLRILIQGGPGYRYSKKINGTLPLAQTNTLSNSTLTARANIRLEYDISDDVFLSNNLSITWDSQRTRIDENISLTNNLISNILTRISLNIRHNTNPPEFRKKTDTNTKVSIVYNF